MSQPFPCDGDVGEERLRLLLSLGTETAELDYKQTWWASNPDGQREFVKDVAGMMSRPEGGYLVFGVDGSGQPVGAEIDGRAYDEATVKNQLLKYLDAPEVVIRSAGHTIDGHQVIVLFLGRLPDLLFPVVKRRLEAPADPGAGKAHRVLLREGDVFVRAGTETRALRRDDLVHVLAPYLEAARQEERDRINVVVQAMHPGMSGYDVARGPLPALTWRLPADQFTAAVTEVLRSADTIAQKAIILQLRRDGAALMRQSAPTDTQRSELDQVIDRATAATALAVTYDRPDLLTAGVAALKGIYDAGLVGEDGDPFDQARVTPVWARIASNALAVVALAVREQAWGAVRTLTLQPVGTGYRRESWFFHASVWAHRAELPGVTRTADGGRLRGGLIWLATSAAAREPALRPDIAESDDLSLPLVNTPTSDAHAAILDSVAQADLAWCLVAATAGRDRPGGGRNDIAPGFGALYEHRVAPLVARLRSDAELRAALLPEADPNVVPLLQVVTSEAEQYGAHFTHFGHLLD